MNSFENYYDRLIYLGESCKKHEEKTKRWSSFEKKWLFKQLEAELALMSTKLKAEISHLEKQDY